MLQNLQENTCTRVSSTGVFLWILQHFKEHIFSQNTSGQLLLLLRYQIYYYQIYYKEFFIFREQMRYIFRRLQDSLSHQKRFKDRFINIEQSTRR